MAFFTPSPRFVFGGAQKLKDWLYKLGEIHKINQKDSGVFAADNLITFGRITGFLEEEKFATIASKIFFSDDLHASIIWRIHVLAWAVEHCKHLDGDMIEFGCYDAKVAEFLIEYTNLDQANKKLYLYDIFDDPPTEKGPMHSPELYNEVVERLSKYSYVNVEKGLLPNSFDHKKFDKLSFVHMDLNSAETEMSLLELFFDKIVPGGILILDDFGQSAYKEQHIQETDFFNKIDYSVVEIPTGQGMVFKR